MKILLIQPPIQDFYETELRLQPLGLGYIKAILKREHPDVEVIIKDYHTHWGRHTIPIPKELKYLKKYYTSPDLSPFSTFYHYYHFGAPYETIEKEINFIKPDIVGISSLFTPYYREVLEIVDRIKRNLNIPIVIGGSHVSALPEFMLSQKNVDYIIRGEGERPFVEFVQFLKNRRMIESVSALGFKRDSKLFLNPIGENYHLDEIPPPDFSDLDKDHYRYHKKPMTFLITSRSCPHRCSFCSVHSTFGMKYRKRSVDSILREIHMRYDEGYRVFDFEDDNLTFNRKEMKELCLKLSTQFKSKPIELLAMNGISYLSLDEELLYLMKEAGFTQLNLSLVTSDRSVLESTKRPHTVNIYMNIVQAAFDIGFHMVSYQIIGLPFESLHSMIQTLAIHSRLPVLLGVSMFYLTPGSPISLTIDIELNETHYFLSRLTSMANFSSHITREDLYTFFITFRIFNFLKSLSFKKYKTLNKLLEVNEEKGRIQIGIKQLRSLFNQESYFYYITKNSELPNLYFRNELFFQICRETKYISNLKNENLFIDVEPNS